ncbi:DUF2934 domain-containing protein [Variovorax saccharolyticus]|uniref:DUF2934 domain-containing protein n=1 Tax=Variovorax saccharolyticus TaxID=3053516 RepID=UPI002578ECA3|nr:DUF2934 domain-containing protein [Variovorax sp. J22R187]MDM0022636.1 DUF2934 domain-containing protein [Variovorax sp. J22R187]
MNTRNPQNRTESEREAVKRSMEQATEHAPAEFRDEANESKIVKVGDDLTNHPIQGIDPHSSSTDAGEAPLQSGASDEEEDRQARIRAAAYAAWERRGGEPGHEVEDWLEAERSLDPARHASSTD